jgi:hypothetical protein
MYEGFLIRMSSNKLVPNSLAGSLPAQEKIEHNQITAAEARKFVENYSALAAFYAKIREEAALGRKHTTWHGAMSQETEFILTKGGYVIMKNTSSANGETSFAVKWVV